jgi:hypothetical protein
MPEPKEAMAATSDPKSMTTDTLRDLINSAGLAGEEEPQQIELSPDTDDEGEQSAEEGQEEQDAADSGGEPELEAAEDESGEGKEEQETEVSELDELRAQLEAERAERKHFETVAGRNAGRLGYLERQNREVLDRLESMSRRGDDPDDEEPDRRPRHAPRTAPVDNRLAQHLVQREIKDAVSETVRGHEKLIGEGGTYAKPFREALQRRMPEINEIVGSNDPLYVGQEIRHILVEAVSEIVRDDTRRRSDDVARKRADQGTSIRHKKIASASAAPGRAAASTQQKARSPSELKTEDLRALINSRAGLD